MYRYIAARITRDGSPDPSGKYTTASLKTYPGDLSGTTRDFPSVLFYENYRINMGDTTLHEKTPTPSISPP